ncbi:unnamed protein product [Strongylus vulgaris]|uniref:Uncharacterized protein n=1 Tax=Strongylus vulgaris TaxID=40348 RepID=A0A3P7JKA0_STRVU|nr:unnamed protein product [Strongylus vulgaris]
MRDLDDLDVLEIEMTDDADSDEEAMGEKWYALVVST